MREKKIEGRRRLFFKMHEMQTNFEATVVDGIARDVCMLRRDGTRLRFHAFAVSREFEEKRTSYVDFLLVDRDCASIVRGSLSRAVK